MCCHLTPSRTLKTVGSSSPLHMERDGSFSDPDSYRERTNRGEVEKIENVKQLQIIISNQINSHEQ
jgi:hypothetical protein